MDLSKRTVSGSTIIVATAQLTDISINELKDDITSYTIAGNEVNIDLSVDFVGLLDFHLEQLNIIAEEKAKNEATAIKHLGEEV